MDLKKGDIKYMKFNLLDMKKEREEYDINTFNLILNNINERIKESTR